MKYKSYGLAAGLLLLASSFILFANGCAAIWRQRDAGVTALDAYRSAQAYVGHGDCQTAQALYGIAAQRDPHFVSALVGLATCAQQLGDYKTAVKAYSQAISVDRHNYRLYLGLGSVEGAEGDASAALQNLQAALAEAPQQILAYTDIAQAFANQSRYNHAVVAITKALRLDPTRSDLFRIRASYNQSMQNLGAAQSDYRLALATSRDHSSRAAALAGSSAAHQQAGESELAISAIRQALALVRDNAAYYEQAASIYASASRFADAIRTFREALPHVHDEASIAQIRMSLGDLYEKAGNPAGAREEYALAGSLTKDAAFRQAVRAKISALSQSNQ